MQGKWIAGTFEEDSIHLEASSISTDSSQLTLDTCIKIHCLMSRSEDNPTAGAVTGGPCF